MKRLLCLLSLLLVCPHAVGQRYNYFAPGGALSCTGTCVQQTVDLTQSGFVIGPLRTGAGGTGTNSTLVGIVRGGNPMTAAELSGDVATSGSNAATIQTNVVTNAKLAQMAANTLKCNNTAGTANALDCTVAQVQTLLSIPALANPTGTVGLTTVNGSATTALRSDGAPPLSLGIAPNFASPWTASPWDWTNAEPRLALTESDQGADLKNWDIDVNGGLFSIRTRTDADGAGVNVLTATRGTTTAITNLTFGNATNNPTYLFSGSGTATFNGNATFASRASFTSAGTFAGGNAGITSASTSPLWELQRTGSAADAKIWELDATVANQLSIYAGNDARSVSRNAFLITRSGVALTNISFGNATDNPTYSFLGTGSLTASGATLLPGLASTSAAQTGTVCWTTGTGNLTVDTTTTCLLSTARVKRAIRPLEVGLAEVMKLRPVSYELKPQYDPGHLGRQVGLISEEVGAIDNRLISHEQDGTPLGVRYQQLTAVLVKAIQEQQQQILSLKQVIEHDHHTHYTHCQKRDASDARFLVTDRSPRQ